MERIGSEDGPGDGARDRAAASLARADRHTTLAETTHASQFHHRMRAMHREIAEYHFASAVLLDGSPRRLNLAFIGRYM
ncbi:hypothetical protein G3I40_19425 [Streptomyces sp. SID14478]|uniref:hypothetical protein n=1 Tax=Streptomyces sp. SID14478 TaxID=2706073 RepID=UPI0013D976D3|nr:hypothetical protein [Streptomyces sp. SID14478]NEB77371.1 hypothetical protein [Streptomyces sp. SID14478]